MRGMRCENKMGELSCIFYSYSDLSYVDFSEWDTANVISVTNMFETTQNKLLKEEYYEKYNKRNK